MMSYMWLSGRMHLINVLLCSFKNNLISFGISVDLLCFEVYKIFQRIFVENYQRFSVKKRKEAYNSF